MSIGIVAPAGTPKDIVRKIYADTRKTLESTEMRARFFAQGLAPVGNSPEELGAFIKSEIERWTRVAKAANVKME